MSHVLIKLTPQNVPQLFAKTIRGFTFLTVNTGSMDASLVDLDRTRTHRV
jgi:hypothetical protein